MIDHAKEGRKAVTIEEQYIDGLYEQDSVLERIRQATTAAGMPDIAIADGYGRLLTMLVEMNGVSKALEIGALGGYSGVCIARGLKQGGSLTCLELLPHYAEVAERNVAEAGFADMIQYIVGDAKLSLQQLVERKERYQFFFIDADKEGYPLYLDYALQLAEPGALIVADNILLRGRTVNEQKQGPAVQAVRSFNKQIAADPRLQSTILPGYDGLAIARVKQQS
ncbi:O-methyltransferase [Paenibacillus montaniterrae]|uniref:O-methyltransferase n=1 Tax=Paenibacillus montaniterrae TaxID=429341 RepID=UPI001BCFD5B8|nr:O-methyltransferase [Paenibacillus montaniterrae]